MDGDEFVLRRRRLSKKRSALRDEVLANPNSKYSLPMHKHRQNMCLQMHVHQMVKTVFQPLTVHPDETSGFCHTIKSKDESEIIQWESRGPFAIRLNHYMLKSWDEFYDRSTNSKYSDKYMDDY